MKLDTTSYEVRQHSDPLEIREQDGAKVIVGYAARFNTTSKNMGGFVETIKPGAFTKTLQEQDIVALFNHDKMRLLGRMSAGTLKLEEDSIGLRYEILPPDTTTGRDLIELVGRGDIQGSSFGFVKIPGGDSWGTTPQGFALRTLSEVALRDVGPVVFPAYAETDVALRSFCEFTDLAIEDVEAAATEQRLHDLLTEERNEESSDTDSDNTPGNSQDLTDETKEDDSGSGPVTPPARVIRHNFRR